MFCELLVLTCLWELNIFLFFCFQVTDKDETENGVSAVSGGLYKYLAIVCKVMWPAISSKGGPYIHLSFFLSAPPSHLLAPPPPPPCTCYPIFPIHLIFPSTSWLTQLLIFYLSSSIHFGIFPYSYLITSIIPSLVFHYALAMYSFSL